VCAIDSVNDGTMLTTDVTFVGSSTGSKRSSYRVRTAPDPVVRRDVAEDNTVRNPPKWPVRARVANISSAPSGMLMGHRKPFCTRIFGITARIAGADALTCRPFRCFT
jgi:hypothetical protein